MEHIYSAQFIQEYSIDSDECGYNSHSGNDAFYPHFKCQSQLGSTQLLPWTNCELSRWSDEVGNEWTLFAFKFIFNILDESRTGYLESLLSSQLYFSPLLNPITTFERTIHSKRFRQVETRVGIFNTAFQHAQPKYPQRVDCRDIHAKYNVYFKATVRPLIDYFNISAFVLNTKCETTSGDKSLDPLVTRLCSTISDFLTLLSIVVNEVEALHEEGLYHKNIDVSTFCLYHLSSEIDSRRWGIQLFGLWQCTGQQSLPRSHLTRPYEMGSAQEDILSLGVTMLKMCVCWCRRILLSRQQNKSIKTSYLIETAEEISRLLGVATAETVDECLSTNICTGPFRDLITHCIIALHRPSEPATIPMLVDVSCDPSPFVMEAINQFLQLLDGMLHILPWERKSCAEVSQTLTDLIEAAQLNSS